MTTSEMFFIGGPWDGQTRTYPSPVPSEVIPVYDDTGAGMVCADEQVVTKLGHYRKTSRRIDIPLYNYLWESFDRGLPPL